MVAEKNKNTHINYDEYTDCLRIQIRPDADSEERTVRIRDYCLKYGIKNVILFINAECFWTGHITAEELPPWIEVLKKAKAALNGAGISVSLNVWTTIGHLERGKALKPGQDFSTMVDIEGKKSKIIACPLDNRWRKYYNEIATKLIEEIQPEIYWIEDDFRLHNHQPLFYGGCFCDRHLSLMNGKIGKNYTLPEWKEKLYQRGECTPERKAWLDVSKETMTDTAKFLGAIINNEKSGTVGALMSCTPDGHLTEARDWKGVIGGICTEGKYIDRIHLACYEERSAKEYLFYFNSISMPVRAFLPKDTIVYPELENASFSTYAKDKRFVKFQEESAIPLLISGMTYDIFDFAGNGTIDGYGYGEVIRDNRKYMQAVMDQKLRFEDLTGIVIPLTEDAVYRVYFTGKNIKDYISTDCYSAGYIGSLGLTYRPTKEKRITNKIVTLFANQVNYYSDNELKKLAENNFLVLDGNAVVELDRRNLLGLICAESIEVMKEGESVPSYEMSEKRDIEGIGNFKATVMYNIGDFVCVRYKKKVQAETGVYSSTGERVANGIVTLKNALILPYCLKDSISVEFFNPLRRNTIISVLKDKSESEFVSVERAGITPYLYKKRGGGYVLMILNATLSALEEVRLQIHGLKITRAFKIDKKTGGIVSVTFRQTNDELTLFAKNEALSTDTYIFE